MELDCIILIKGTLLLIIFADTQSPNITCPDAIMAYADASQTFMVTWNQPTVMDNSNEVLTVQQTAGLSPGSNFSKGLHSIKYMASDSAGNEAMCTFFVNVQGWFKMHPFFYLINHFHLRATVLSVV